MESSETAWEKVEKLRREVQFYKSVIGLFIRYFKMEEVMPSELNEGLAKETDRFFGKKEGI
jgi:hypothetical protein